MDFGDVAFIGDGPQGPMTVGMEVKKMGDLINCIESNRFTGHQLPGLKASYDVAYLVVVGEHRANWDTGELQIKIDKGSGQFWWTVKQGNRTWMHYDFMAWLTMVEVGWGVRTRTVTDYKELARVIVEMWRVLNKPWEEHKTLRPWYLGPEGATPFAKPTLVERVVSQVEGIGQAKAREIGKRFTTVGELVGAPPIHPEDKAALLKAALQVWKGIPGVGKPTASKILESFWYGEVQSKSTKEGTEHAREKGSTGKRRSVSDGPHYRLDDGCTARGN
jgi:ERCC4-type nuclease